MISFIFPSDPFEPKKCEENYLEEYNELKNRGYSVHLVDTDNLYESKIYPAINSEQKFIYRGWMLQKEDYQKLEKKFNNQLMVTTEQYLKSHHLPQWYESIKDITMSSIITTEESVEKDFLMTGWSKAFIKDYVKSLKTGKGSIVDSVEDISRAIKDMKQYRGYIEGGIVLREVKQLNESSERRYFVINNTVYANE